AALSPIQRNQTRSRGVDAGDSKSRSESGELVTRRTVHRNADATASGSTRAAAVSHAGRRSAGARHGAQRKARQRHGSGNYVDGAGSPRSPLALAAAPRQAIRSNA